MIFFERNIINYNIKILVKKSNYLHHASGSRDGSRGDAVHANAEATPLQGLATRAGVDCTFGGASVDLVPSFFDDRFLMKTILDDDFARTEKMQRN